jgi:transducin (beta)-like 1
MRIFAMRVRRRLSAPVMAHPAHIYAFLIRLGFVHASFALRAEAGLEKSQNFAKYVPHGELVDLLSKALLFQYIEKHGISETPNCVAHFSLLQKHVCVEPPLPSPTALVPTLPQAGGISDHMNVDPLDSAKTPAAPQKEVSLIPVSQYVPKI